MIHFFIKDNSTDRFHDIELAAWKEDKKVLYRPDNEYGSSFTRVEEIRFHSSISEDFQTHSFKIDFGKNSCIGHNARSSEELTKSLTGNDYSSFETATSEEYMKLREKVIKLYLANMKLNFSEL